MHCWPVYYQGANPVDGNGRLGEKEMKTVTKIPRKITVGGHVYEHEKCSSTATGAKAMKTRTINWGKKHGGKVAVVVRVFHIPGYTREWHCVFARWETTPEK
jgi:hypothetical protein